MIKVGDTTIEDIRLGETTVTRVYAGENLVYSKNALPYDYEVEYLLSNGNQYIDTLIYGDDTTEIGGDIMLTTADNRSFCGSREETYPISMYILSGGASTNRFGNKTANIPAAPLNSVLSLSINKTSHDYNYHNGQSGSVNVGSTITFTTAATLWFFGCRRTNANFIGRLMSAYIIKNGTYVFDAIPVVKNGVGYLYDRISGNLFGNGGTGSFVIGPRVSAPYDYAVEYLEATSGLYINTGYVPTTNNVAIDAGLWIFNFQGSYAATITAYTGENNNAFRIIRSNNELTKFLVNHNTKAGGNGTTVNFPAYEKLDIHLTHTDITINGTTTNLTLYLPTTANTLPIKIMGTSASSYTIGLFYYTKIKEGANLLFDLIPVVKNGVGCLYNKVDGTFFYNAGSGDFIIGPEKQ